MHYYILAFYGLNLAPLTYESDQKLEKFQGVKASLKGKILTAFIVKETGKPEFKTSKILEILPINLTSMQSELAIFISKYYTCELGVSLNLFEPNSIDFSEEFYEKQDFDIGPKLNERQQEALEFLNKRKISLIFGDTGSGKSEIYIAKIREILNAGSQALFLMPEISLTPQMQKRLEGFFGEAVAVWHSKITPKKKEQILKDIKSEKVRLVAGARSALFLPLERLKLIIIDEEHDDSYKNTGSKPHYNARDLALFLTSKFDLQVVLGSATPSLTSFYKQEHFRLKGTYFDSQKNYIFDESETGISEILKDEISKTLANKKQTIICLPTRANFKYLVCKNCGETLKCPFCSIGMSYYKKQNVLKCQYCEHKMAVPKTCHQCGSEMIEAKKIGTSELLERLQAEFANARIAKFDRDEITTQNKLVKALKEFNDGKIDILLGTQMLSKGHDYHNVELAVIMGFDELLNFPDYRARERTLALAMQVAGRAGRNGAGRVIIQSKQREFFEGFISDYDAFLKEEIGYREGLYPPFTRLLRIIISHKDENIVKNTMNEFVQRIEPLRSDELEIIGYGKCQIEYLGSKFRYEILLRSNSHIPLLKAASLCKSELGDIDIDPVNFS
ncbi:primosomal protein N' [uncultured Campylobacter sp.]|uniref:primosomal protein N' n=1 Tax=uncultured Campylobacter sp. TaxID=218934 RepID=UPI0015BB42C1|nr:primosomal protein N' [uncultured Campylobacter sp.]